MYDIDYSQEAKNYLDDNPHDFHAVGVKAVLELTADTLSGLLDDPGICYYLSRKTNRVYCLVEQHFVEYHRGLNELYVDVVKPLE